MKLTRTQIQAITKGAERITEQDGAVSFFRFTQAEEELYKKRNQDFYQKSFATAGIRLEFFTDSRHLSLSVRVSSGSSRKFFSHDVLVNGKLIGSLSSRETNTGLFSDSFDLGLGEKQVCVYLPWSVASKILSLELDDGATLTPVKKSRKMLIYGDSITQGYDALRPPRAYAARLTDALDAEAFNKAIGGEVFCAPLAELAESRELDVITVAYGTNDFSRGDFERFEGHASAFYRTLAKKYPSAKIFAITPIWRADYEKDTGFGEFFRVRETISRIADTLDNVTVIDGFDFVPKNPSYFADLRLHPNDEGFDLYADALIREIQQHL